MFARPAACAALSLFIGSAAVADYKQDHLCVNGDDEICSILPGDLDGLKVRLFGYTPTTNHSPDTREPQQIDFDFFGWQSFVALNWPADAAGKAAGDIFDDDTSPRVWQHFHTIEAVFPPKNRTDNTCVNKDRMTLSRMSKITSSSFIQPMTPWPLIDAAGNFVLYDVRLNDRYRNYVHENGLYTKTLQEKFRDAGGEWDLPRGTDGDPGAIEVKTAWRLLPGGDNSLGYFTQPVNVIVPAENSPTGEALCLEETAGLVGMHIMQKVASPVEFAPFWIWASFEHARNAPQAEGAPVSQLNRASPLEGDGPVTSCPVPASAPGDWGFFNIQCHDGPLKCTANAPPRIAKGEKFIWNTKMPYAAKYLTDGKYGTQVTRCWQLYPIGKEVDATFRKALGNSIWANYQLIGVQWANDHGDNEENKLRPFPAPFYMVNSTLETYLQTHAVLGPDGELNRDAPSSCINCHAMAKDAAKNPSNFSFAAGYAE